MIKEFISPKMSLNYRESEKREGKGLRERDRGQPGR
jgi:hypothetical protein